MTKNRGPHRRTNRQRIRTACLAASLLLTTVVLAEPTNLTPTDINGPKFDPRAEEAGAYSVNERTGTVGYSYKFKLPPGRGVMPSLGLTYSSAGSVRGGVAQGWDLSPVASIKRDTSRETDGTVSIVGVAPGGQYTASVGGAITELIQANADHTANGGIPYRAKVDSSFMRFEFHVCPDGSGNRCWTAYSMDGRIFRFTELLPGDWKIQSETDVWGNHSRYVYDPIYWAGSAVPVDYVLHEIWYTYGPGGESTSGIQPHARVSIDYLDPETTPCNSQAEFTGNVSPYGLNLPVGAAVSYRTGSREITGLKRMQVVHAQVRDTPSSGWRDVHRWTLGYDSSAERCDLASPRRQLSSIAEIGIIRSSSGIDTNTPGPTVTFAYGRQALSTPTVSRSITLPPTLPVGPAYPDAPVPVSPIGPNDRTCPVSPGADAATRSMLSDLDGDGLPDLVRTDGMYQFGPNNLSAWCNVYWYRNTGSDFEQTPHAFRLPAPRPVFQHTPGTNQLDTDLSHYAFGCGLNVSWFAYLEATPGLTAAPGIPPPCVVGETKNTYTWTDIDGDGRTDIITDANTTARPQEDAQLCIDPACGLDNPPLNCAPSQVCRAAGFSQTVNLNVTTGLPTQFKPRPCSASHATPPPLCPNGFTWTMYFNHDDAFSGGSLPPATVHCSPVALANGAKGALYTQDQIDQGVCKGTLESCTSGGECCSGLCSVSNNTCMPQTESSPAGYLHSFVDVNGDRIPDILSASYTRARNLLLFTCPTQNAATFCDTDADCVGQAGTCKPYCGYARNICVNDGMFQFENGTFCANDVQFPDGTQDRLVFNVFLGHGDGTFAPAQLWRAPGGASWSPECDETVGGRNPLLDINGDGLNDLIHEAFEGGYAAQVAYGNGHGFDGNYSGAASSYLFAPGLTLFQNFNPLCDVQFPTYLKDLDSDGVLDFACMALDPRGPCPPRSNGGPAYGIGFGNGGGFSVFSSSFDSGPVTIAGQLYNYGRTSQIELPNNEDLRVAQDYIDLNGDGIADRFTIGNVNDQSIHVDEWNIQDDAPPGLLYQVTNGLAYNGVQATIRFHYSRTTSPSVMILTSQAPGEYSAGWPEWIPPALPFPQWVVTRVEVDSGSDHRETTYAYFDPVFLSDDPLPAVSGGQICPDQGCIGIGSGLTAFIPPAAPGRRFRGFQAVLTRLPANPDEISSTTTLPTPPLVFERFTYRHDPDGQLDYRSLSSYNLQLGGYTKLTVDQTTYDSLPIGFSNVAPWGRFPAPIALAHIECPLTTVEGACEQSTTRTTTSNTWSPNNLPTSASSLPAVLFYTKTAMSDSTFADAAGTTSLRRDHWFSYSILDSGTQYLASGPRSDGSGTPYLQTVTSKRDVSPSANGATNVINHYEQYFYDGSSDESLCGTAFGSTCHAALTKKRVYRDTTYGTVSAAACSQVNVNGDLVCVDYGMWYDGTTGNKIIDVRPAEMASAGGDPLSARSTHYFFDTTYSLFPIEVRNELAQRITHTFDLGTGLKTQEQGPNVVQATECEPVTTTIHGVTKQKCHSTRVFEERDWAYDGLGRLIAESMPHDDPTQGYVPATVRRLVYSPFPQNIATEYRALEWGACDCGSETGCTSPCPGLASTTIHTFDGLDRLVQADVNITDGIFETHNYAYDARDLVTSVTDPNPGLENGNPLFVSPTVTHTFDHDARGRVTKVTAPDRSTMIVTYGAWEKTVRDADGVLNHQVVDGFGELRQVDETGQTPAEDNWAPAGVEMATTVYSYDGIGRLLTVADADCAAGLPTCSQTIFMHDGENHRTSITRGPKLNWTYRYDANGGLASKTDPAGRITSYAHDVLERVTDETLTQDPLMDAATQARLGVGRLHYIYDNDRVGEDINGFTYRNRIGRLAAVEMYVQQATQPYAAVDFGYDGSGDTTVEQWSLLNIPETGTQHFNLVRDFGPNGLLESTSYPNGQVAEWSYDQRGKVDHVDGAGKSLARFSYGRAGLMTTRDALGTVSSEPLQEFIRQYDTRGRVISEGLQVGSSSLGEAGLNYSPDGDLLGFSQSLAFGGPTIPLTFNFRYDGLHRLRAADATTPAIPNPNCDSLSCGGPISHYAGRFLYTAAGNITAASVSGMGDVESRSATYTYGDGMDVDRQAVTHLDLESGATADFEYDESGNMRHRAWPGHEAQYRSDANDQIREATTSDGDERYFYDQRRHRFLAIRTNGSDTSWRFYFGDEFEVDVQAGSRREEINLDANAEAIARLTRTCNTSGVCTSPSVSIEHHSRRGDLLAALGSDGTLQSEFTYGPWGELIDKYDPNNDWRRRFNGKEQDQIDGLSYYGYRYYDPLTLRWSSADPLNRFRPDLNLTDPQALDLYSFEINNPLRFLDPDGLDPQTIRIQIVLHQGVTLKSATKATIASTVQQQFNKISPDKYKADVSFAKPGGKAQMVNGAFKVHLFPATPKGVQQAGNLAKEYGVPKQAPDVQSHVQQGNEFTVQKPGAPSASLGVIGLDPKKDTSEVHGSAIAGTNIGTVASHSIGHMLGATTGNVHTAPADSVMATDAPMVKTATEPPPEFDSASAAKMEATLDKDKKGQAP